MFKFFRRRPEERRADIKSAWGELGISCLILICAIALGGVGIAWEMDGFLAMAGLVGLLGFYALGQSILGVLIEHSIGMGNAVLALGFFILAFCLFQGYRLLTSP